MSKSHLASITSKPLFISVAESMVTFFPIFHLGWFKASLGVMAGNFSMGRFKKGPPDAVSISLFISPFLCPAMYWYMALCSLSTGRMFTLFFLASSITNPPAITRTSLFARAMSLPALIAARVGIRPDAPTSAETTMSAPSQAATSIRPSSPQQALGVYESLFFIALISPSNEWNINEIKKGLSYPPKACWGDDGLIEVAACDGADMVVSALVGASGLMPTLAAIRAGRDIALANKEVLVMAGGVVMEEARKNRVNLLPVDSEHSAIFQSIAGHRKGDIKRLILTASGGPFLNLPMEKLPAITPKEALNHPRWNMWMVQLWRNSDQLI